MSVVLDCPGLSLVIASIGDESRRVVASVVAFALARPVVTVLAKSATEGMVVVAMSDTAVTAESDKVGVISLEIVLGWITAVVSKSDSVVVSAVAVLF